MPGGTGHNVIEDDNTKHDCKAQIGQKEVLLAGIGRILRSQKKTDKRLKESYPH
jgi:hypothetical protein